MAKNWLFWESSGQFTGVHTTCSLLIWYLHANLSWLQGRVMIVAVFWFVTISHCLTHFPGTDPWLSFMVATYQSDVLKVNSTLRDMFIYKSKHPTKIWFFVTQNIHKNYAWLPPPIHPLRRFLNTGICINVSCTKALSGPLCR